MSLPPGFLDELRSRLSLSQVVGRKVIWDTRKSNQGKGDMWAPCPFHQEKSASFHVDDRKGFYYCFGCHEKGDAISFVRETENLSFIEAVKLLASEAGMEVPERDPQAQAKADRRDVLVDVMEAAARFFQMQLSGNAGREARQYLEGRKLDRAAQERWQLGFAPASWDGLRDHLTGKGIPVERIVEAGLAKTSQKGRAPYDTFRNRIIYPIRDARGRCIAFGGRAMDPDDNAKYLNSPETPLFDKGRTLYNMGPARAAAGKSPLIVAEGYMDVIALSEAGFASTVAPLGTAVTEDQLRLMWRMSPEPIVALDGDEAGQRAALRLMDLALPMIEAGQSLRFCLMPPGQDPDDVLRSGGREAMEKLLSQAQPMVDVLWRAETAGRMLDTPEARAALDKSLRERLGRIRDPSLRRHYGDAIKERRWHLFNPRKKRDPWVPGRGRVQPPASATTTTRASALALGGASVEHGLREQVVLAILLRFGELLPRVEDALAEVEFRGDGHSGIAAALLRHSGRTPAERRAAIEAELAGSALENLLSARHLAVVPALRGDDSDLAAICLGNELAKMLAAQGAAREIAEAMEDLAAETGEALTWRLGEAARARDRAQHGQSEDTTEYEEAPNGVKLNRSERDALDVLLEQIGLSGGGDRK
ncbi:DNA primase [Palleronia sp. LCG004]|uniref:DNA primase n=1 Tax=Palleronia sp. LCG004 TaxID=3079304 RepID=UPI002943B3AE|nr:DNA primase [Palleronia sp. LCG004]WOI57057.1 DNA primase [Palleronia sp. LCG004]